MPPSARLPWRLAVDAALYGPHGFYRDAAGPAGHFRTSAHVSAGLASALVVLARRGGLRTVVDVGAGRGELAATVHALDPGLRVVAVDVVGRPASLPRAVEWATEVPDVHDALLVANEWLDDVPCDVVELTEDGARVVLVDPGTGDDEPGPAVDAGDLAWLDRWWPLREVGDRAEVGSTRDAAWAQAVSRLGRGIALAVDYDLPGDERPPGGTLTGYRAGRAVPPVPDGSCDVTAHVVLQACAAATAHLTTGSVLVRQREALLALGLARSVPGRAADGGLEALAARGDVAELTDPGGLGGFGWLVQSVGMPLSGLILDEASG